jgi:hypothetical protein
LSAKTSLLDPVKPALQDIAYPYLGPPIGLKGKLGKPALPSADTRALLGKPFVVFAAAFAQIGISLPARRPLPKIRPGFGKPKPGPKAYPTVRGKWCAINVTATLSREQNNVTAYQTWNWVACA